MDTEQLFDSTQETAYRLCALDPNIKKSSDKTETKNILGSNETNERVFSCQWDPNNNFRLFVCTQSGRLYVNDFDSDRISSYQVLFQPYTSGTKQYLYDEISDEKVISYHWDKLVLVPNRPDELIFLLGMSNKVMHTSLPNPLPNSSKSKPHTLFTNKDVSDFIYGSPILELYGHSSRVMSMGICSGGQVLATGSEDGQVKLLSIQLLDMLSSVDDPPFYSVGGLNKLGVVPVYKLSRRIHNGPIFALNWIESYSTSSTDEKSQEYRHCLVTGSSDRTVHLWTVFSSNLAGVQLYPLLNLSIIASNVLSISSLMYNDKFIEQQNEGYVRSQHILSSDHDRINALQLPSPYSCYLAVGTHVGTIYTWRINKADLVGAMDASTMILDIDDGRFLHSMIISCDRPIITISLTASSRMDMVTTLDSGRVAMSVSDTMPSVKLFHEADVIEETKKGLAWREKLGPLAFYREIKYSDVVVASAFKNNQNLTTKGEQESQLVSTKLFVITVDGTMQETSI
jgi:WD40 repeat protein